MRALVAGWRDDDALGPVAVVVAEDSSVGVAVEADALRLAIGEQEAEIFIDELTLWVTVVAGESVSMLPPVGDASDVDLETARDLGAARAGRLASWQVDPDLYIAAATVRQEGFRTIVSWPGEPDTALAGRLPHSRAAALAHEQAVDRRASAYGLCDIPDRVLAHYDAVRIAYAAGPARGEAVRSVSYRSGMSAVGDLSAAAAAGVPTGVVISELSDRGRSALLEANARGVRFFIDSGAFAARREGAAPVDFDEVLRAYQYLAERAENPELLSCVAPDLVGDRDGTLALLARYSGQLRKLAARGVELLVPLQRHVPAPGEPAASLADTYRETIRALGHDDFRPALPGRVAVFSETEILEFVRDAQPPRLHLLGVGSAPDLAVRLARMGSLAPGIDVSTDACQFRAVIGQGRPLQTIIDLSLDEATRDAVLTGHIAPDKAPLLGSEPDAPPQDQATLFAPAAGALEAYGGSDITEFLYDLYNSPGFLDREAAGDLARRLTLDPAERERLMLAALDAAPAGTAERYGSKFGNALDRFAFDDRAVEGAVVGLLLDEARAELSNSVRRTALADLERDRDFWAAYDLGVEHPFACGLGEAWRGDDGSSVRMSDGRRITWFDHLDLVGAPEAISGGVYLYVQSSQADEAYVAARGRVARFPNADAAREAFTAFTSPDLATWLARQPRSLYSPPVPGLTVPAATAAPSAPAAPVGKGRIEDFGEVLHGARKHYYENCLAQLERVVDIDAARVTLAESWPELNYSRLVEEGVDPWAVAMARALRDHVPSKPTRSWRLAAWVRRLSSSRELARTALTSGAEAASHADLTVGGWSSYDAEAVIATAKLYSIAGHARSMRGIETRRRMHVGAYGVEDGETWELRKRQSGYKIILLAKGPTLEAAIEAYISGLDQKPATAAAAAEANRFGVWKYPGGYSQIEAKVGRERIGLVRFNSSAQAHQYLREHRDILDRLLAEHRDVPDERRAVNEKRTGPPRRQKDCTVDEFAETFGFRGVQFGNWCAGARRQEDLNNAYDALSDLAAVLGVTPRSLSLDGKLGLAFGARGRGGRASAHYEPYEVVINLTKTRGSGSLAHEWFHALDNAIAREAGLRHDYATVRHFREGEGVSDATVKAFAGLRRAIYNDTGMYARAERLDRRRTNKYWSTPQEIGARTFEAMVIDRLAAHGIRNDYLANVLSEADWEARVAINPNGSRYPYPTADEVAKLRDAFMHFVSTLEWPGRKRIALHLELVPEVPALDTTKGTTGVAPITYTLGVGWSVVANTEDREVWDRASALGGKASDDTMSFAFPHPGNARAFIVTTELAEAEAAKAAAIQQEAKGPDTAEDHEQRCARIGRTIGDILTALAETPAARERAAALGSGGAGWLAGLGTDTLDRLEAIISSGEFAARVEAGRDAIAQARAPQARVEVAL